MSIKLSDIVNATLNTEATSRSSSDSTLVSNINSEVTARASADSTLTLNLNAEITARQNATFNAAVKLIDGTAAAPAVVFTNDINTGMFLAATNQLGFATDGVVRLSIDALGKVGIGTSPATSLHTQLGTLATATINTLLIGKPEILLVE